MFSELILPLFPFGYFAKLWDTVRVRNSEIQKFTNKKVEKGKLLCLPPPPTPEPSWLWREAWKINDLLPHVSGRGHWIQYLEGEQEGEGRKRVKEIKVVSFQVSSGYFFSFFFFCIGFNCRWKTLFSSFGMTVTGHAKDKSLWWVPSPSSRFFLGTRLQSQSPWFPGSWKIPEVKGTPPLTSVSGAQTPSPAARRCHCGCQPA